MQKFIESHHNGSLASSHLGGYLAYALSFAMQLEQESFFTSSPVLVCVGVFDVTFFSNLFGMQKLVDKHRGEAIIVEHIGFQFCSRDGHIKEATFFSVWELIAFCQYVFQHGVVAYERRESVRIVITLQQDHIIGFEPLRLMYREELYLAVAYYVIEPVAILH